MKTIKKILKTILKIIAIIIVVALVGVIMFFGIKFGQLKIYENMPLNLPDNFTVTAHTGCMGTPHNSFEAMKMGVENGAQVIEFDVRFLADGTPVLAHDTPKGNEITLEEAFVYFAQFDGIRANVDIKETKNLAQIEYLAAKYDILDRIFLTGVTEEFVEAVKKDCPNITYYLNLSVEKGKSNDSEYIASLIKKVKDAGAIGINCNYKNVKSELVKAFQDAGLLVSLWTVNKKMDMHKILNMAPNNITTKSPDMLSEIIVNRQKNS